jgi:hypothetical protein
VRDKVSAREGDPARTNNLIRIELPIFRLKRAAPCVRFQASQKRRKPMTNLTRRAKFLPLALAVFVLSSGCGAPLPGESADEEEVIESSQEARAAACSSGAVRTTLIQPGFTSSIPQMLSRLKITARNFGSTTCSIAGTIEYRQNGTLIRTDKLPARDFPPGFSDTNPATGQQFRPPVDVKVCYGAAFTCLSKHIDPPIGE